ncbi:hypothetical protein ACE6H2_014395 [Prunus campanulata]
MTDTKAILPAIATVAASAMLLRSIANDFIPNEFRNYFFSSLHNISRRFSSHLTIVIDEFQGLSLNEVFEAAEAYLGTLATPSLQRIKVSKVTKEKKLGVAMDRGEEICDVYEDHVQVMWKYVCTKVESSRATNPGDLNASLRAETRSYELTFHKKHKEKVLNSYLPYILDRSKGIKVERKVVKLCTIDQYECYGTQEVNLNHPMTFEQLAMDMEIKKVLLDDLNNFKNGKEFYRRIGKAWKRGYLLYGPPGTGKSSLIAAIANHLNYDIYELELADVGSNSDLKRRLLAMPDQSILVIEDIDCTINLQNRETENEAPSTGKNQVTLSGLLNLIDGLWSCCTDERIIIFTTNHKEKLDPALVRPGRMDMHINMSYCTLSAFKQLAFNYHGLSHHQLFEQIDGLIGEVKVTPAEVAGELMKSRDAQTSLQGLINFLLEKKNQQEIVRLKLTTSVQKKSVHKEEESRG